MAISVASPGGFGDDPGDRIHEGQALVLRVGRMRFGSPIPAIEHRLRSIRDLKQLEKLLTRIMEIANWQDLFPLE